MDDHDNKPSAPAVRFSSTDKRTSISVIVIFVIMLIIFPILISLGKREQRHDYYQAPNSSSRLKFD